MLSVCVCVYSVKRCLLTQVVVYALQLSITVEDTGCAGGSKMPSY